MIDLGHVKWFDEKKGFGFIRPSKGGDDVFVHYKHIISEGFKTLHDNDIVEYKAIVGPKGIEAREVLVKGR